MLHRVRAWPVEEEEEEAPGAKADKAPPRKHLDAAGYELRVRDNSAARGVQFIRMAQTRCRMGAG